MGVPADHEIEGYASMSKPSETHGCDYYLIRDGKVAVRSTFRKA
jgi:hypothetical protein